jgi:osmotically-inducible protein OsmY
MDQSLQRKKKTARKKKTGRSRGLQMMEPNIVLVGTSAQTRPLEKALDDLKIALVSTEWHRQISDEIGDATKAVMLIEPLPGINMAQAMREISGELGRRDVALFAVVGGRLGSPRARALYDAGATAVVEWPREAKPFPHLVAEMLAVEMVRGKASGPDDALKRSIEARLRSNTGLSRGVRIDSRRGVVSLSSLVDSLWKKRKIEDLVSRIPGVRRIVTRHLRVSPSGLADRDVAGKVRGMLRSTSGIDAATISVSVDSGAVTLAGTAADRSELEHVEEVVSSVKGVRSIENLITISRARKEKDHIVARRVQKSLAALFPRQELYVSVFGGVAVVSGRVELLKTKREVEDVVRGDGGVLRVLSKISVE